MSDLVDQKRGHVLAHVDGYREYDYIRHPYLGGVDIAPEIQEGVTFGLRGATPVEDNIQLLPDAPLMDRLVIIR